jgi:hypothetical protein
MAVRKKITYTVSSSKKSPAGLKSGSSFPDGDSDTLILSEETLYRKSRFAESVAVCDRAIMIRSDYPDTQSGRCLALLTTGDITFSNTTAHIAGAMGKDVLLMLPHSKGRFWYWQAERDDSLFYPGMQIFRQQAIGDWSPVIDRVCAAATATLNIKSGKA